MTPGLLNAAILDYDALTDFGFGGIRSIETCTGNYFGEKIGEYRLIRAYIGGSDMIFLDQVETDGAYLKVINGYSFTELSNDHSELSIEYASCHSEEPFVTLKGKVNGTGHDANDIYSFEIKLNPVSGSYEYSKM